MITEINKLTNNIKKINIENIENEYLDCLELYDGEIIDYIFLAIHNYSFDELKYEQKLKRINQWGRHSSFNNLKKNKLVLYIIYFNFYNIIILNNLKKYIFLIIFTFYKNNIKI